MADSVEAVTIPRVRRRAWPPTSREATVMAWILAINVWAIAAVTVLLPPGLLDMFGHLKAADFVQFYAAGTIVRTDRPELLYDHGEFQRVQVEAVPASAPFLYLSVYPPQSAVVFAPLSRLPYGLAALVWLLLTAVVYGVVTALAGRGLHVPRSLLIAGLIGFPPFWQLMLHGGSTAWALAAFGFGGTALIADRRFIAGLLFALLAMKPQLGLVLAVILVSCREWRIIAGIATSWGLQVALSMAVVGFDTWVAYVAVVRQLPALRPLLEPEESSALMHSLSGLVAMPSVVEPFAWIALSALVVYRTWRVWRGPATMSIKLGTLVLASVLVSPHLFQYDATLLALSVLWIGRALTGEEAKDFAGWVCLLIIALLIPTRAIIGIQLSVVMMMWILYRGTASYVAPPSLGR